MGVSIRLLRQARPAPTDASRVDITENAFEISEDIRIPVAQDHETLGFKPAGPFPVACRSSDMLAAVEFDHQSPFETAEVGDVAAKRRLPPETCAINLLAAQSRPEQPFRIREVFPKVSCAADRHATESTMMERLPPPTAHAATFPTRGEESRRRTHPSPSPLMGEGRGGGVNPTAPAGPACAD